LIMQSFVGFYIPLWLRRLLTMIPAFVVVGLGVNATSALVASQVVLSLAVPVPIIALVMFTRRPDIMGSFANGWLTHLAAVAATIIICSLNLVLLSQIFGLLR
jgi:manganese transport protein